ncbi:hypothetical protein [uncultured Ruminococcus sp.]|uniref:hypothetical protein n=1 Tax=uncultured Ruminococcus sp. TaxID=165186 RepID=UPI0025CEA072|nr:hypothetical protein [uncultured Ruminococcus sp.]
MDDLMNKLQDVLNDEESMKQIKELADMIVSQAPSAEENSPVSVPAQTGGIGGVPQNTGGMPDISALLRGLGMGGGAAPSAAAPAQQPAPNIDISKIMQIGQVISQANKSDKNVDLLLALRPLLKEENQNKIDKLIKIFRLLAVYPVLKESGLLGGDLFGLLG